MDKRILFYRQTVHFKNISTFVSFYFLDTISVLVANSNKEGINNVPSIDKYQCHTDWSNTLQCPKRFRLEPNNLNDYHGCLNYVSELFNPDFISDSKVNRYIQFVFKCHNLCIWQFYDHFWSFFCQLHEYLSQNLGADVHFEVLNVSKFYLDKKVQHKKHFLVSIFFFNFGRKHSENL